MIDICKRELAPDEETNPHSDSPLNSLEILCDGKITGIAFAESRSQFAYSSQDSLIYVRKFNTQGKSMALEGVLQGHQAGVTGVKYHSVLDEWISISDDGSVRIWQAGKPHGCRLVIYCGGRIQSMDFDLQDNYILAAVGRDLRIFDVVKGGLVQTHKGHRDSISAVAAAPASNVYITSSWDANVRFFAALATGKKKTVVTGGRPLVESVQV